MEIFARRNGNYIGNSKIDNLIMVWEYIEGSGRSFVQANDMLILIWTKWMFIFSSRPKKAKGWSTALTTEIIIQVCNTYFALRIIPLSLDVFFLALSTFIIQVWLLIERKYKVSVYWGSFWYKPWSFTPKAALIYGSNLYHFITSIIITKEGL